MSRLVFWRGNSWKNRKLRIIMSSWKLPDTPIPSPDCPIYPTDHPSTDLPFRYKAADPLQTSYSPADLPLDNPSLPETSESYSPTLQASPADPAPIRSSADRQSPNPPFGQIPTACHFRTPNEVVTGV
jgi:hypothetical protein